MSGRAIASRRTTSRQAAYSERARAQELAPRRHPREQLLDRDPRARRQRGRPLARQRAIVDDRAPSRRRPRTRLSIVSRATLAIEGSASPRKPSVATCSIASSGSFEVAWRSSASAISAGVMPQPSSTTSIRSIPPPASATAIRVAPASIAFSTSSFSALAGRSTTSPAAIRLTRCSGRRRIDMVCVSSPMRRASRDTR